MPIQSIRGRCLIPRADAQVFDLIEDALLQFDAGKFVHVGPAPID